MTAAKSFGCELFYISNVPLGLDLCVFHGKDIAVKKVWTMSPFTCFTVLALYWMSTPSGPWCGYSMPTRLRESGAVEKLMEARSVRSDSGHDT